MTDVTGGLPESTLQIILSVSTIRSTRAPYSSGPTYAVECGRFVKQARKCGPGVAVAAVIADSARRERLEISSLRSANSTLLGARGQGFASNVSIFKMQLDV